ncbi:hypothetical protein BCR36DRAFT_407576 [Piromyces finnis]|uniref:Uncharacterized protein n=1 Tax=Piromyces finnis TaxID=1754191 RepID=A0A1Y1UT54_9FUNG|nr:hypothetical protein BCR36DRAFT_407576 [Piromyces finnis]|eukprot:ORX40385.1 hypothetical protein BCR36DRAFT_407576 [Piromyces finnis]
MKVKQILNASLFLSSYIYTCSGNSGNTYYTKRHDVIDDNNELFSRECKYAMTSNLYMMKSCLEYLESDLVTEEELSHLCDSFQDYYAKDSDSEGEEDKDDGTNEELDDLYLVGATSENQTKENVPIMSMSNITEEEAEVLYEVTKVINNIDKKKSNTIKKIKYPQDRINDTNFMDYEKEILNTNTFSHSRSKASSPFFLDEMAAEPSSMKAYSSPFHTMCHVKVRRWRKNCKDVSRIASIINTSLEIFYFRRQGYCIRNQQNKYCTVTMNEIHQKSFNGTDSLVIPLTEQDRNTTCECYQKHMTYLQDEYNSSIDSSTTTLPQQKQKYKPYSKNSKDEKQLQNDSDSSSSHYTKRTWNENNRYKDTKKENQNNDTNKLNASNAPSNPSLHNKIRNFVQMLMYQLTSTTAALGLNPLQHYYHYQYRNNIFPSYRDFISHSQKVNNNKDANADDDEKNAEKDAEQGNSNQQNSDFMTELRGLFLREFLPEKEYPQQQQQQQQLRYYPHQKRMESDVNIQQLEKLINRYHNDMSQYMDISTCNITINEFHSKDVLNNSIQHYHYSTYYLYITLSLVLIQILQHYIL